MSSDHPVLVGEDPAPESSGSIRRAAFPAPASARSLFAPRPKRGAAVRRVVVVIHPDESSRRTISALLQEHGIHVVVIRNSWQVHELVTRHDRPVNAIVSDLGVARELCNDAALPPVVAITGASDETAPSRVRTCPLDGANLLRALHSVFD